MDSIMRLDEPNLQIMTFFSADKQQLFLRLSSWVGGEDGSIHNSQVIQGTPEQLKALIADEIYRACEKEINLPQLSYDDEAMDDIERRNEANKNSLDPKELPKIA